MTPAQDIRDIRPLIAIPPWWHGLGPVLAGVVLLALLAGGLVLWRRRSRRPLTAEGRALQALSQAERLAHEGRAHEWADVVASTLRAALTAHLGADACPRTSAELGAWMEPLQDGAVDAPRLLELLTACDLTRFAMGRSDADALLTTTDAAREWIARLFAPPARPAVGPSTPSAARPQVTS